MPGTIHPRPEAGTLAAGPPKKRPKPAGGNAAAAFNWPAVLAALRSHRDVDACQTALDSLRAALAADPSLATPLFATHSPLLTDLAPIWDAQAAARHEATTVSLLRAAAAAVRAGGRCGDAGAAAAAAATAASFASGGRRLRLVYYCLASGSRPRVVAALDWLAAVATAGGPAPAALAKHFDWGLPALSTLARPPRPRPAVAGGGPPPPDWRARDRSRRPAAALLLQWGAALCRAAASEGGDGSAEAARELLRPATRPLFSALLDRLASVPCADTVTEVVQAVHGLLRAHAGGGAPPAARAGALGDAALGQLVAVSAAAAAAAAPESAAAAAALLTDLATDPSLGFAGDGSHPSAKKRWARAALARLRPLDAAHHWSLAAALVSASPADAASLFAACPLTVEPGDGPRWLAAAGLAVRLGRCAARAPLPGWMDTTAVGAGPPPPPDSPAGRALLTSAGLPPPLSRAALSRGVLCPDPLARHAALVAVAAVAGGAGRVLAALDGVAGAGALASRVRAGLRAALPDAQALVSAHSAAVGAAAAGPGGGAAPPPAAALALVQAAAAALAALLTSLPACAVDARLENAARLLPPGCEAAWPAGPVRAALAAWEAGNGGEPADADAERSAAALPHLLRVAGGATDEDARARAAAAAAVALASAAGEGAGVGGAWVRSLSPGKPGAPGRGLLATVAASLARRPLDAAATVEALPPDAQAAGPLAAAVVGRALTGAAKAAPDAAAVCAAAAAGLVAAARVAPAGLEPALASATALVRATAAAVEAKAGVGGVLGLAAAAPLASLTPPAARSSQPTAATFRSSLLTAAPCPFWARQAVREAGGALVAAAQAGAPPPTLAVLSAAARTAADRAPGGWAALLDAGGPVLCVFMSAGRPAGLATAVAAAVAVGLSAGAGDNLRASAAAPVLARVADEFERDVAGEADDAAALLAPWLPVRRSLAAAAARLGRKRKPPPSLFAAAAALLYANNAEKPGDTADPSHVDAIAQAAAAAVLAGSGGGGGQACLAAALAPGTTAGRRAAGALAASPAAAALLTACLEAAHLSPHRAIIAAALAGANNELSRAAAAALPTTTAAAGPPGTPARREAAALTLPVAVAVLDQASADRGVSRAARALVDDLRPALEGYLCAKSGAAPTTAPPPRPGLSPAAEASLRQHAATAAGMIWRGLGNADCRALAARLAPAGGWPASAAPPAPAASGAARPATGERLTAALALTQSAPGTAPAVAACVAATLASLAKQRRRGRATPADGRLEEGLWAALDGALGDALARPGPTSARAALAPAASSLVRDAVRAPREAGRLRRVRRLLAALLPSEEEGEHGPSTTSEREAAGALAALGGEAVAAALAAASSLGLTTPAPHPLPAAAAASAVPVPSILAMAVGGGGHDALDAQPAPTAAEAADLLDAALALEAAYAADTSPTPGFDAARAALPALRAAYGATLCRRDRAMARVLAALCGDGGGGDAAATPLAGTAHPSSVDARRAALSAVQWPESRTLAADDADDDEGGGGGGPAPWHHPAGADPAAVLPSAVEALRDGSTTPAALASSCVLPLALRALASKDAGLRWAGYEVAALTAEALEEGVAAAARLKTAAAARRAAAAAAAAGGGAPPPPLPPEADDPATMAAAAAAGPAGPQLLNLLRVLRSTAPHAGARLPALVAVFAAEAAAALTCPASPAYGPANRALLRAPALALGDVPWLKALGGGGGGGGKERGGAQDDRDRLVALLAAGMRSPADGFIFRKRFLAEMLMGRVWAVGGGGGEGAAATGADGAASAALTAIPAAAPALALDLAGRAGYVEWLGDKASGGDAAALAALGRLARRAAGAPPSPAGPALVAAAAAVADSVTDGAGPSQSWPTAMHLAADAHRAVGGQGPPVPPALRPRHVRAALLDAPSALPSVLATLAALPPVSVPASAGPDAITSAWSRLAGLAVPAAAAAAAGLPGPAWGGGGGGGATRDGRLDPQAAVDFLAWLAVAVQALPPPAGEGAVAAQALADAAGDVRAALPAGIVGTAAATAGGGRPTAMEVHGAFGAWRAELGMEC